MKTYRVAPLFLHLNNNSGGIKPGLSGYSTASESAVWGSDRRPVAISADLSQFGDRTGPASQHRTEIQVQVRQKIGVLITDGTLLSGDLQSALRNRPQSL